MESKGIVMPYLFRANWRLMCLVKLGRTGELSFAKDLKPWSEIPLTNSWETR